MIRKRNYVVLIQVGTNTWHQFTAAYARSPTEAVDQATAGEDNSFKTGTFRAVPTKAWGGEIER